ncbi:hypothetical protein JCM10213v2_008399 [Rhodosporidiobolus nylandii]
MLGSRSFSLRHLGAPGGNLSAGARRGNSSGANGMNWMEALSRRQGSELASMGLPTLSEPQRGRRADIDAAYLAATSSSSTTFPLDKPLPPTHPPPIIVLSLPNTLIARAPYAGNGPRSLVPRPYLSTFLEYLSSSDARSSGISSSQRRFFLVVYSHATGYRTLEMLAALSLIPPSRFPPEPSETSFAYEPRRANGDVLHAVLSNEMLGLSWRHPDPPADLDSVWEALGVGWEEKQRDPQQAKVEAGARRTVLLASSAKASPSHPAAHDTSLLSTIYLFERLRYTTHIASALRSGLLSDVWDEVHGEVQRAEGIGKVKDAAVDEGLAKRGREVCRRWGIEVKRDWDAGWRDRMLKQEEIIPRHTRDALTHIRNAITAKQTSLRLFKGAYDTVRSKLSKEGDVDELARALGRLETALEKAFQPLEPEPGGSSHCVRQVLKEKFAKVTAQKVKGLAEQGAKKADGAKVLKGKTAQKTATKAEELKAAKHLPRSARRRCRAVVLVLQRQLVFVLLR